MVESPYGDPHPISMDKYSKPYVKPRFLKKMNQRPDCLGEFLEFDGFRNPTPWNLGNLG